MDQARQPIFVDLTPLSVLPTKQYREARRLVMRADRLWEAVLEEQQQGVYESKLAARYAAQRSELAKFAESALKASVGIEPYMVLDITRYGGFRKVLQVERVSIESRNERLAIDGLVWRLAGRNLRKNGTLGEKVEMAYLSTVYVERRELDGVWRPLTVGFNDAL